MWQEDGKELGGREYGVDQVRTHYMHVMNSPTKSLLVQKVQILNLNVNLNLRTWGSSRTASLCSCSLPLILLNEKEINSEGKQESREKGKEANGCKSCLLHNEVEHNGYGRRITEQLGEGCHSGHEARSDQWGQGLPLCRRKFAAGGRQQCSLPKHVISFHLNHPNPPLNIKFQ